MLQVMISLQAIIHILHIQSHSGELGVQHKKDKMLSQDAHDVQRPLAAGQTKSCLVLLLLCCKLELQICSSSTQQGRATCKCIKKVSESLFKNLFSNFQGFKNSCTFSEIAVLLQQRLKGQIKPSHRTTEVFMCKDTPYKDILVARPTKWGTNYCILTAMVLLSKDSLLQEIFSL